MKESSKEFVPFCGGTCKSGWLTFQNTSRNRGDASLSASTNQTKRRSSAIEWRSSQRQVARTVTITRATANRIVIAFRDEERVGGLQMYYTGEINESKGGTVVEASRQDRFMTPSQVRDIIGLNVSDKLNRQRRLREGSLKTKTALRNRRCPQRPKRKFSLLNRITFA